MRLWIVGKAAEPEWEFCGVFDDESKAADVW